MAKGSRRLRKKRAKRLEAKLNWEKRQAREREVSEFVNSKDAFGDIYNWQTSKGFGVETKTPKSLDRPYVDNESGVLITPDMSDEEKEILRQMGLDYNLTADEKRLRSFQQEYEDMTLNDYNVITSILGNDLYQILKESQYLDSSQIIDDILKFNANPSDEEIERALLSMVADISREDVSTVREAIELGFKTDEIVELLDVGKNSVISPAEGIIELRERIKEEIGNTNLARELERELREQGERL